MRLPVTILRIIKWEFWPFWIFYIPFIFYWLWLSLKARSFIFFSAANPCMYLGGFYGYSKYEILKKVPAKYLPSAILISKNTLPEIALQQMRKANIIFPAIAKPDVGERGKKVRKIDTSDGLNAYFKEYNHNTIIQQYIDLPMEFGVMYYRYPDRVMGVISSVVQKEFLPVCGDGKSTLLELMQRNDRARYHLKMLRIMHGKNLYTVIEKGRTLNLIHIGNHCRGCTFRNANHLIDERLTDTFDVISKQIPGFFFGRYDVRTTGVEEMKRGDFKIIELNGVNSEPSHIYDPDMSIRAAYSHLFEHWKHIYNIGVKNHLAGIAYANFKDG